MMEAATKSNPLEGRIVKWACHIGIGEPDAVAAVGLCGAKIDCDHRWTPGESVKVCHGCGRPVCPDCKSEL